MLIIRCDAAQLPGLYSEVTDRRTKPVGKIQDIFGSVKAPCALVLCHGPCDVRPNEKLFAKEPSPARTPAQNPQRNQAKQHYQKRW
jgi:RNA-binding protein